MTVFKCAECGVNLSKDVERIEETDINIDLDSDRLLPHEQFLETPIENLWSNEGDYALCNVDTFTAIGPYWDENKNEEYGWSERAKFYGCCGMRPSEELNVVCSNNHKVGIRISECYLPNCVILDSDSVNMN